MASALLIATITTSVHANPSKEVTPVISTQIQETPTRTQAILKAGYNAAKITGIGLSTYVIHDGLATLKLTDQEWLDYAIKSTRSDVKYGIISTCITIPALAHSIYDSYYPTKNKQQPEDSTTLKKIAKTAYNIGKLNGIIFTTRIAHNFIKKAEPSTKNKALFGMISAAIIATLGESFYNDYQTPESQITPAHDNTTV